MKKQAAKLANRHPIYNCSHPMATQTEKSSLQKAKRFFIICPNRISLKKVMSHLLMGLTNDLSIKCWDTYVTNKNMYVSIYLCHTTACFHMISIFLLSGGDHPCAHYLHYLYVPWLIMTSQWVMTLLGMPHCGTTLANDDARDIHCDITMDNDVTMCT